MVLSIARSVGFGGANLQQDVRCIQDLLNLVPGPRGGPMPLLECDGLCGPFTIGAIRQFQKTAAVPVVDGRIDPMGATLKAIEQLLKTLGITPGAVPVIAGMSPVRAAIVAMAHSMVGSVSDQFSETRLPLPEGAASLAQVRRGWRNLQSFFDDATTPTPNWTIPRNFRGVWGKQHKVPKALGDPNDGMPNDKGTTTGGTDWCGIFTTWVWRRVGLNVMWNPTGTVKFNISGEAGRIDVARSGQLDPKTKKLQVIAPRPGDVCGLFGTLAHHLIVVSEPVNGVFQTVNGNSDFQGIVVKPHNVKEVFSLFSPHDDIVPTLVPPRGSSLVMPPGGWPSF